MIGIAGRGIGMAGNLLWRVKDDLSAAKGKEQELMQANTDGYKETLAAKEEAALSCFSARYFAPKEKLQKKAREAAGVASARGKGAGRDPVITAGKGSGTLVGKGPRSDLDKEKQAMLALDDADFEECVKTKMRDLGETSAGSSGPNPEVQDFDEWVQVERARREAAQVRLSGAVMPGTLPDEEEEEAKKELAEWEKSEEDVGKNVAVNSGFVIDEEEDGGDEPLEDNFMVSKKYYDATGVKLGWDSASDRNQKFQLLRRAILKHLKDSDATIEYFYHVRAPMWKRAFAL